MSDIGLPPGFGLWLLSLGWCGVCAFALVVCLIVTWVRARKRIAGFTHDRFFGWAIGAAVSGLLAGFTMWLINWSGSLGAFAHWLDRSVVTCAWFIMEAAFWPAVALVWNRACRRANPPPSA